MNSSIGEPGAQIKTTVLTRVSVYRCIFQAFPLQPLNVGLGDREGSLAGSESFEGSQVAVIIGKHPNMSVTVVSIGLSTDSHG